MDTLIFEKFRQECIEKLYKVIDKYYDWENDDISEDTDFLYQSLVNIVDGCKDIDFCNPSEQKLDFASTLLTMISG